jgi:tetratricopeptide (TPR) repeat protein
VAYGSLLSAQRAAYHRQVAEYLEDLSGPETWAQHHGGLAYHYRQAGESRKELFYTIQVAEQARGVYANAEALEYYSRALELLDDLEAQASDEDRLYAIRTQRFEVLNGRREVLFLMGDFEVGQADAQALLPLARHLDDDPAWLIDALLQQPGVAGWRNREELDAGIPMAQEALDLARQLGDQRREMQSLIAVARQRYWVNDPTGRELAERALELARQLGDQRHEVSILTAIGQVYAWRGQPERSVEYLETALPICQALDDKGAQLDLLSLIGVQLESGDDYYRRLVECHEEQVRISREIGHRPVEAQALMFCGQIRGLYLGDYEGGLALLEDSLRAWEGMPDVLYPLLRIVQIQVVQGGYDEARKTLERARRAGERHTAQIGLAGLDLVSAIFYNALGSGRTSDARAHLQMALDLAARNREVFVESPQLSRQYRMVAACEVAAAHLELAQAVADESDRRAHLRQALESSQAALEIYEACGYVRPVECVSEEILYRHSLALAANGQGAEAAEYVQRAYDEVMRKHDLIPPDSLLRRTYLENIPLHRDIRARHIANRQVDSTGE